MVVLGPRVLDTSSSFSSSSSRFVTVFPSTVVCVPSVVPPPLLALDDLFLMEVFVLSSPTVLVLLVVLSVVTVILTGKQVRVLRHLCGRDLQRSQEKGGGQHTEISNAELITIKWKTVEPSFISSSVLTDHQDEV